MVEIVSGLYVRVPKLDSNWVVSGLYLAALETDTLLIDQCLMSPHCLLRFRYM